MFLCGQQSGSVDHIFFTCTFIQCVFAIISHKLDVAFQFLNL